MMALLEIRGLSKNFGGVRAIDELHLEVNEREIVSVIGPNGAGKTTLFNLITGMLQPDEGKIIMQVERVRRARAPGPLRRFLVVIGRLVAKLGRFVARLLRLGRRPRAGEEAREVAQPVDIVGLEPSQILKLGIARTFQSVRLFAQMTVRENVMVARHARTRAGIGSAILRTPGFRREERETRARAEQALAFFGDRLVGYRFDQLAMSLSYANRRRLEIARAMASDPKILLLDEPTAGMNPRETQELTELIGTMRAELGLTIVLIEHDMRVVKGVSDRVVVLDYGRKIAEGSYDEIARDDRVIEAYLGTKATA